MKFKRRNSIDLADLICGNIGYDQPGPVSGGLAEQVVIEVLFGLQQRCAEKVKTHRAVLRPLCDELRRTQVGSVADLPEHRCGGNVGDLTRSLVAHCRRGLSSPETEQAQDVWDLRVFGTKTPSPDGSTTRQIVAKRHPAERSAMR